MASRSALTRLAHGLKRILTGREYVGSDLGGNHYFKFTHQADTGRQVEKREVEFARGLQRWDGDQIPVEWRSWMTGARATPPTPEEISANDSNRQALSLRAEAIRQEDDRARALRGHAAAKAESPDLNAFMGQLGGGEASSSSRGTVGREGAVGGAGGPEVWTPGSK